jgi:hypothetical protein
MLQEILSFKIIIVSFTNSLNQEFQWFWRISTSCFQSSAIVFQKTLDQVNIQIILAISFLDK